MFKMPAIGQVLCWLLIFKATKYKANLQSINIANTISLGFTLRNKFGSGKKHLWVTWLLNSYIRDQTVIYRTPKP